MSRAITGVPVVLVAALLTLSGCAAIRRARAADTEDLLAAAGFQRRVGDTAEQLTDHKPVAPFKLVAWGEGGKLAYVYADPENCHCLYVGGPKEYAEYQRLLEQREFARDLDIGFPAGAGR